MPRTTKKGKENLKVLTGTEQALRRLLEMTDLNQADLARQMNVNETSVSRALAFKHSPSISWIDNYLHELGVTVEDFARLLVEESTGERLEIDESIDSRLKGIERQVKGLEERLTSIESLLIRVLGR